MRAYIEWELIKKYQEQVEKPDGPLMGEAAFPWLSDELRIRQDNQRDRQAPSASASFFTACFCAVTILLFMDEIV